MTISVLSAPVSNEQEGTKILLATTESPASHQNPINLEESTPESEALQKPSVQSATPAPTTEALIEEIAENPEHAVTTTTTTISPVPKAPTEEYAPVAVASNPTVTTTTSSPDLTVDHAEMAITTPPKSKPTEQPTIEVEPLGTPEPSTTEAPTEKPEMTTTQLPVTKSVEPPQSAKNCFVLQYEQIINVVPDQRHLLAASQCVNLPHSMAKNIVSVTVQFSFPPSASTQLMVTSEPQLIDMAEHKTCEEICSTIKKPQSCVCIVGQAQSANSLFFASSRLTEDMLTRHFTIMSEHRPDSVQFSTFMDSLGVAKVGVDISAGQLISGLLNNIGFIGPKKLRTIVLNLPRKEEDSRLKLTAMPLVFNDRATARQFTRSCLINDDVSCHVDVDPSFNYDVIVENMGKLAAGAELFTLDQPHLSQQQLLENELSQSHRTPMHYVLAGVVIAFIWLLGGFMVVSALRKKKVIRSRRPVKGAMNLAMQSLDQTVGYNRLSSPSNAIKEFIV